MRLIYMLPIILTAFPIMAVSFDQSWREQKFPFMSPNSYALQGNSVDIQSQNSVSILYRPMGQMAKSASWNWQITKSVPATNLAKKGGDDRNLAIYFLFMPEAEAQKVAGQSAAKILQNSHSKALIYTYGGDRAPAQFPSPYGQGRAQTLVLHSAQTGAGKTAVNLASDFETAFGHSAEILVGVGISADSDDTNSVVNASVSDFRIE